MVGMPTVRVAYAANGDGLTIAPLGKARLFEEVQGFSVMDLLKNPMLLMMLPLVLTMFMPKLTANMSPEDRAVSNTMY